MLTAKQSRFLKTVAWVYMKYGHADKAIALLELQLRAAPEDFALLKQLAYGYYKTGHYKSALFTCKKLLAYKPSQSAATSRQRAAILLLASLCYAQLGEKDAARRIYRQYTTSRAAL